MCTLREFTTNFPTKGFSSKHQILLMLMFQTVKDPFVGAAVHIYPVLKPFFHLATLFARRKAKTRIWQRDWLKLVGAKFAVNKWEAFLLLCVRVNKFAKWKIGLYSDWNLVMQALTTNTTNKAVASSIIRGADIHIYVFTHHKNDRFQKKLIVQKTNI